MGITAGRGFSARKTWPAPAIVGLVLLAVVLANVPGIGSGPIVRSLLGLVISALTVYLLTRIRRKRLDAASGRGITISLAAVAVLAATSYYDFGRFHGSGHFVHPHEFYHYYMGSKYFPELGYDGLYAATYRALVEIDPGFAEKPILVRNLRSYRLEGTPIAAERGENAASLFSPDRWNAFTTDIRLFQSRWAPDAWQFVLIDYGFNPTPFWTTVGAALSSRVEPTADALLALSMIDVFLMGLILWLLWYAFGPRTMFLAAIFCFGNAFVPFDITGGAFLRQLWLLGLVACLAFRRRRRMELAGAGLAIATLDRIFPILFLLIPAVVFVRETIRRRSMRHDETRFLAAFAVCLLVLGAGSAVMTGGLDAWSAFLDNIHAHEGWFFSNTLSLRSLFTANPATLFHFRETGWDEASWLRERETLDAGLRWACTALRGVALLGLVVLIWRRGEESMSWALVAFAPFLLLYPADYYSIYLLPAVIFWERGFGPAVALFVLQGVFWFLKVVFPPPLDANVELRHLVASAALTGTFLLFLARGFRSDAARGPSPARGVRWIAAGGSVAVLAAVIMGMRATRGGEGAGTDLVKGDVRAISGASVSSQSMAPWGSGWKHDAHLVFVTDQPPAKAVIGFRDKGTVRNVKVVCSTSPAFGTVRIAVNGVEVPDEVNLYSPRVGLLPVLVEGVTLGGDVNELQVTVTGKDIASGGFHFAIDRVAGTARRGEVTRKEALARAMAWVRAHPADYFDGGWMDMAAEAAALAAIAEHTEADTSERAAQYARDAIHRLGSRAGYAIPGSALEDIAAAAGAAHELRISLPVFTSLVPRMSEVVAASAVSTASGAAEAPPRPLFLCAYLERLHPDGAASCDLEAGILAREYRERRLLSILMSPPDPAQWPVIAGTFHALARDALALTDYGRVPGQWVGTLADSAYWDDLAEQGLRRSIAARDVLTTSRVLLLAACLGRGGAMPLSRETALDFIIMNQESDGSFGAVEPDAPNPFREGVLTAAIALAWD